MKKNLNLSLQQKTLYLAILLAVSSSASLAAPVGTMTTFNASTTAQAAQVNGNFTAVKTAVDDNAARIGTIETVVTSGNVVLGTSTAITGNIMKGANRFIHNFGTNNTFLGVNAGNFTMAGVGGNTASGGSALASNTTGAYNTATGYLTLINNTTGDYNTANGVGVLHANTDGSFNTASGNNALRSNTTGGINTATGNDTLANNTTGNHNTALGAGALTDNTTGTHNTAVGVNTLYYNKTGSSNIAIGFNAGLYLTTGNDNIAIGHAGAAGNIGTIRIGTPGVATNTFIAGITGVGITGVQVIVNSEGQLGIAASTQRVKDDITDMGEASSTLMKLRPVTFHYKSDQNPKGRSLQYGLIAEEVEKVAPGLVARSAKGEIETVFYQHLTPMLLNEYQKQQRTIDMQTAELKKQSLALAQQNQELTQQTQRVAMLEKQGGEIVALKQELARMAALFARLQQPEKVASLSH